MLNSSLTKQILQSSLTEGTRKLKRVLEVRILRCHYFNFSIHSPQVSDDIGNKLQIVQWRFFLHILKDIWWHFVFRKWEKSVFGTHSIAILHHWLTINCLHQRALTVLNNKGISTGTDFHLPHIFNVKLFSN